MYVYFQSPPRLADTQHLTQGVLRLKTAAMSSDYRPIDSECDCMVCMRYSRAHLHAKITKVNVRKRCVLHL